MDRGDCTAGGTCTSYLFSIMVGSSQVGCLVLLPSNATTVASYAVSPLILLRILLQLTSPPAAPSVSKFLFNFLLTQSSLISYPHPLNLTSVLLFHVAKYFFGLPLWSSGQSSWLQTPKSRDRIKALQDYLSSSGSGMGSAQHCEDN
jgi:hypothetical protein